MTVGAPTPGDRRDGEVHQVFGDLPEHFDLEPWAENMGDTDARYWRSERAPEVNEAGEPIWIYEFGETEPRTTQS